jgi:xanthine dehydrogenase accessory factor
MLVSMQAVTGTIGGGHLEHQAIARARSLLARAGEADFAEEEQGVALGPSLGQCCGGSLVLHYARLTPERVAAWPPEPSRFHLLLFGAGHVGRAIVQVLADVPCTVQWVDEREDQFPQAPSPPHVQRLCAEPVQAEVASAPPGSHFLVLTHSHALDLALADTILKRGDFAWFGLIGSRTKRARFERRLMERGHTADLIARMVCPIGLPGITGKEPGVIAVAVVAQCLLAATVMPQRLSAAAPAGPSERPR